MGKSIEISPIIHRPNINAFILFFAPERLFSTLSDSILLSPFRSSHEDYEQDYDDYDDDYKRYDKRKHEED
jgi:hypothetical protein